MRPDIAFFLPDLAGGGAERVTVNLAAGISASGYSVDILLVNATGPYIGDVPKYVRIVELSASRTRFSIPAIARYVRTNHTPVIISALHHSNLAALFAKKLYRLPARIIPTIHNTVSAERQNSRTLKGRLQHALVAHCYGWSDRIVAVSNEAADDFADATGFDRSKITTIYNPVVTPMLLEKAREPIEHPWFRPQAPPVVVAIGRLSKQKDFSTLIRAFNQLVSTRAARLMILGEGEQRGVLEHLVATLELQDKVALPGFVPNPYAYLSRANVFVLSSKWEGLPTVLIEALALGVPLVATDCKSGPREILADGKHGTLVPVGDAPALARAITMAMDEPKRLVDESVWARYSAEAAVSEYIRVAGLRQRV